MVVHAVFLIMVFTPYRGSMTPRFPVKRKLVYTTPRPIKRSKAANLRFLAKRYVKGPSTRGTLYSQVKSLQRSIRSVLPEIKQTNVSLSQSNITTAGTISHVTAITGGTGDNNRVGEDIRVKKIAIKGFFGTVASGVTASPVYYRCYLIVDTQQQGDTTPTLTEVFNQSDPVLQFPSPNFSGRYRFLYCSPIMSNNSIIQGTGNQGVIDYTWSGDLKVGYNGGGTTDIQKNGVYFIIQTNDGGNVVDFNGSAFVYFTDA